MNCVSDAVIQSICCIIDDNRNRDYVSGIIYEILLMDMDSYGHYGIYCSLKPTKLFKFAYCNLTIKIGRALSS